MPALSESKYEISGAGQLELTFMRETASDRIRLFKFSFEILHERWIISVILNQSS
jgi:hypothetical protein